MGNLSLLNSNNKPKLVLYIYLTWRYISKVGGFLTSQYLAIVHFDWTVTKIGVLNKKRPGTPPFQGSSVIMWMALIRTFIPSSVPCTHKDNGDQTWRVLAIRLVLWLVLCTQGMYVYNEYPRMPGFLERGAHENGVIRQWQQNYDGITYW